ncbi:MAG: tetratricopeptide repeat protein [Gemmatimonadaceae bacterium]
MTLIRLSAALALALGPMSAMAQAKCDIDEKKPNQVKDASGALTRAELPMGKPEDKINFMKQAVTLLTKDADKITAANAVGRNWVLGRAYADLVAADTMNMNPVSRAKVGLATSPEGTIDLIAAADSAFDAVEAAQPACKDQTEEYRRKIYAPLVNSAVNLYNQQKSEAAGVMARRGLEVYDGYKLAYIAYNIQGNVLQSKDSIDAAVKSFKRMTELMKGDTTTLEDRKNTMINIAQMIMLQGDNGDAAAKKAKMAEASAYLQEYLKEFPGDAKAQGALARAQISSGDAGAAERVFGEMVASPDKYSDSQLFEAGVNAARAERPKDAAALFAAGLKKNPYSRDGLFNLAVTLQNLDRWDDMVAPMTRLVQIDPENPDNYRIWATYYQGKAKIAKAAAAKKPATSPEAKAYAATNDSLLKYFNRMQQSPVKVAFTLWSHDGNKHTLGGTVDNLTDAAKSVTLKFDFLDATGNVVSSKEAPLADIAAKGSKAFKLEAEGAGIVAFKYAPLGS